MKKIISNCLICMLLILASFMISTPAIADWEEADGHKMHWPQLPDPMGWDVQATYDPNQGIGIVCADDWQCSETGWVKDIHWWGSWRYNEPGTITSFVITISENIPADDIIPWSRPGETLVEYEILPNDWIERGPYEGDQGWYEPQFPEWWPHDHTLYWQYNWFMDEEDWFWQERDEIYWLSISAVVLEAPYATWGWKSTYDYLHFMDDAVWSWWWDLEWYPLTYPTGSTMDLAFVITGGIDPCIEIDKKVWDEDNKDWVEEIDADVCTEVEFKLEVHNCGDVDLSNVQIIDSLPDCLEYVLGSAMVDGIATEPDIDNNDLTWSISNTLSPCNTIIVSFKAHLISSGLNVNSASAFGDYPGGTSSDTDTAVVNGNPLPGIKVDKRVSDDDGISYHDYLNASVCTIVRFRLLVTNTGNIALNNIKIVDILPGCLDYANNATPNEPTIVNNTLTWVYPGPLLPGNSMMVEFNAHVNSPGENRNWVNVTADIPGGGTVSDGDSAVVYAYISNNPPLKPQIPYKKNLQTTQSTVELCSKTNDPDGDQVFYKWDFGDGTISNWDGPHNSGDEACVTHTYSTQGTYTVKVKAKDTYGAESPWSDPASITVSKSKNNIMTNILQVIFQRLMIMVKILEVLKIII